MCVWATLSSSPVQATETDDCISPRDHVLIGEQFVKCLAKTEDASLGARERAQVKVRVAAGFQLDPNLGFANGLPETAFEDLLKSAAADDPKLADSYLVLAEQWLRNDRVADAIRLLDEALVESSTDARLLALKAKGVARQRDGNAVNELCKKVEGGVNGDHVAYQHCAEAFWSLGEFAHADRFFKLASQRYDAWAPLRASRILSSAPAEVYGQLLSEKGQNREAAEVLASFAKQMPDAIGPGYLDLAKYQEDAGLYLDAAETLRVSADKLQQLGLGTETTIRRIVNLALGGKSEEAEALWHRTSQLWTKREVLRMQVRLKNGAQKNFVISGKVDKEMDQAMIACIKDQSCYKGLVGRSL